jgi:hypothetical protein
MHYKLYTLVDITNTKQYQNSAENRQARSQQQNFDTVIQTIGMRANVDYTKPPEVTIDVPKKYNLDSAVLSNIWIFEWRVEREFLFLDGDDDVGYLKQLFNLVPYIPGLTETMTSSKPIFLPGKNIAFEMLT